MTMANRTEGNAVIASTKTVKTSSSDANFARKISRALIGQARQAPGSRAGWETGLPLQDREQRGHRHADRDEG